MLYPIPHLSQDIVGDVDGILRDEINADSLRADQAHNLLDLVAYHRRQIGKQQVSFVKEKYQLGFFRIANLGQPLVEFRQQPKQQRRIHSRRLDQLIRSENVDYATAIAIGLQHILEVQGRLAEEFLPTFLSQCHQPALDRADAGGGDISILRLELLGMLAYVLQGRLEVFQVQQQ